MPRFIIFQFPHFNSLPHAEVDKTESMQIMPITHFNSLPHAEVDAARVADNMIGLAFQLTTSRRGRRIRLGYSFSLSYFNSLPHAEVDQKLQMLQQRWKYFNSLPHAEVDQNVALGYSISIHISTHYLTQR